jgi:hypothetical protein
VCLFLFTTYFVIGIWAVKFACKYITELVLLLLLLLYTKVRVSAFVYTETYGGHDVKKEREKFSNLQILIQIQIQSYLHLR